MSLECGECERDLRGPHDPSCSRYKPPARCRICSEKLVEDDFGLYCPTHGASSAEADPYAALSQHLHGDGGAPTAGDRLIASAAEAVVTAWRIRALAAEAEVERLRAAIPKRGAEVRRAALEEAFAAIDEYPRAAPSADEWMRYDEQIEHSQGIIRALIDTPPRAADTCATDGCADPPVIRLVDRRLCRGCYAAHDFGDDA